MQDADIYVKTDAGRDEIKSRSRGLSMAVRAILLMVDGQRNVAALKGIIGGSKAPADTLDVLAAQGLIESRDGTPYVPPAPAPVPVAAPAPVPEPVAPPPVVAPPVEPPPAALDKSLIDTSVLDLTLPTIYVEEPPPTPPPVDEPIDLMAPIEGLAPATTTQTLSPQARYEHLYTMTNEVVRDFLPAHRRYFIQLKIERCGTAEELLEVLHDVRAALAKTRGDAVANDVVARLRAAAI